MIIDVIYASSCVNVFFFHTYSITLFVHIINICLSLCNTDSNFGQKNGLSSRRQVTENSRPNFLKEIIVDFLKGQKDGVATLKQIYNGIDESDYVSNSIT